jgi:hypothetical protein
VVGFSIHQYLIGGFNPPEKYESQIGSSSQLLGKIKNVPNHQSDIRMVILAIIVTLGI